MGKLYSIYCCCKHRNISLQDHSPYKKCKTNGIIFNSNIQHSKQVTTGPTQKE